MTKANPETTEEEKAISLSRISNLFNLVSAAELKEMIEYGLTQDETCLASKRRSFFALISSQFNKGGLLVSDLKDQEFETNDGWKVTINIEAYYNEQQRIIDKNERNPEHQQKLRDDSDLLYGTNCLTWFAHNINLSCSPNS